jgi:endonuclease YncB( thermonuclease family)
VGTDGLNRVVATLAAGVVVLAGCGGDADSPAASTDTQARVDFVGDGDTIQLVDGRRVRLVQIDAPELVGECYGQEARAALRRLVSDGARVRLVRDPALDDKDDHGRLLRYVEAGATDVNLELVRRGAAAPYFYRGDRGRRAAALERAAEDALRERRGLWRACPQARLRPTRSLVAGPVA